MSDIDRAVGRILRQKFRLGLFDRPYVDPDEAARLTRTKENQELALRTAREGIVLLKNDQNLLPLSKSVKSIAVIGPNADDQRQQLGDYTPRRILHDRRDGAGGREGESPQREGHLRARVRLAGSGTEHRSPRRESGARGRRGHRGAGRTAHGKPARDRRRGQRRASLELTGRQEELLQAVVAAGKPTVLVLSNGRPLAIRWAAEHVPAIVEAWNSGERGGEAVADVLFGDYNPSGRLAITFPRHSGQLPMYYNYMPSKARHSYVDMPITPLWEFGYG